MRKYNHALVPGRTIVVGTEQGLHARIARLARPVLRLRSTKDDGMVLEHEYELDEALLAVAAQAGGFWSYATGTAYRLLVDFGVGGLSIDNYCTSLPLKKGLSSSAAVCVLVARAFNRAYGLRLTTRGEMQYAYEGERMTPSQCGKMDQACAFGSTPVLMTYSGDVLSVALATVGAPLHLVLVDLAASKDTVVILEQLQAAFPHPSSEEQRRCVELLGAMNADITSRAVELMAAGDAEQLGALMREAQQAFAERAAPLCPSQLTSPVLHRLLAHPPIQHLLYGGKGVGSQGDGTAQLLCRDAAAQGEVCRILAADFPPMSCMPFTVPPTAGSTLPASSNGAATGTSARANGGSRGGSDARVLLEQGASLAAADAKQKELLLGRAGAERQPAHA
ncbi:GHMP kinase [Micractinium conductrix]|uniref:GHMP kinase n=1 Tax=Micractinium conductrix TaxID=554055 RepID=A0A2P6VGI0_9CHLO|nr:GHMP kinase [Micractinium conductrix]|eukprot:PSC73195.1 GHMP kinase [Micractinium conductrix]